MMESIEFTSSWMQIATNQVLEWSVLNHMKINIKKTKEMLGVLVTDNLSWDQHINDICLETNERLHFLKLLKRSSMSSDNLLQYYKLIIRPVMEYACPVWQTSATNFRLFRSLHSA
jgi:hypothetical protein